MEFLNWRISRLASKVKHGAAASFGDCSSSYSYIHEDVLFFLFLRWFSDNGNNGRDFLLLDPASQPGETRRASSWRKRASSLNSPTIMHAMIEPSLPYSFFPFSVHGNVFYALRGTEEFITLFLRRWSSARVSFFLHLVFRESFCQDH